MADKPLQVPQNTTQWKVYQSLPLLPKCLPVSWEGSVSAHAHQECCWISHLCPTHKNTTNKNLLKELTLLQKIHRHYPFNNPFRLAKRKTKIKLCSIQHPVKNCICCSIKTESTRAWKRVFLSEWTSTEITRMWANAKRDGRPDEYRWRPLFNDAKFGWRPLPECCAVTLPRRETSWN